jgi:hypothetical protein
MGHVIEPAKSSRAKCRKCREALTKGELRFGHELESAFSDGTSYQWYHLSCAAQKVPLDFGPTLEAYDGDIDNRSELRELVAKNRKKAKPKNLPYGERAPSGRASCMSCEEKIAKGELRVATPREDSEFQNAAGYLHPGCAAEFLGDVEGLEAEIRKNSVSLEPPELDELCGLLA